MTLRQKILLSVSCILVALVIACNVALSYFANLLDQYLGTVSTANTTEDVQQAIANSRETAEKIAQEGMVLLKNEDGCLPLDSSVQKINMFGWDTVAPYYGGSGSGAVGTDDCTSLLDAMRAKYSINEELIDMYTEFQASRDSDGINSVNFDIIEAPKEYYTEDIIENAKAFSDIAIVTLGRTGGEGCDLPTRMDYYFGDELNGSAERSYLELHQNEEDMLDIVCSNFDEVIILVNALNAMELTFVEDYPQIKAVLNVGGPGDSGFKAVPQILSGEVNPSGRTADTYAYDQLSAPAMVNFGDFYYTNPDTSSVATSHFVNYVEGIYVGYRYYETRGYTDGEDWYNGLQTQVNINGVTKRTGVQYPFGYGLSYTDFEWRVTGQSLGDIGETISIEVEVTNIGDMAGKDVVELYYTAPYTPGGIEKSHVVLGGFAKTNLIEPGESDTVTITMNVDDMSSYDYETEGAYVLEEGVYQLKLQTDAHHRKEGVDVIEYRVNDTVVYNGEDHEARSSDSAPAVNRFDFADISNSTTDGYDTYLSRNDWEGTWPRNTQAYTWGSYETNKSGPMSPTNKTYYGYGAEATATIIEASANQYDPENDPNKAAYYTNDPIVTDTPYYYEDFPDEYKSEERESDSLTVVMTDMQAVPYEDEETWDKFLGQMSIEEYTSLFNGLSYASIEISSIGKQRMKYSDGPAGFSQLVEIYETYTCYWPCETVLACTWNVELAEEMGEKVGNEAAVTGIGGWYAPSMNTHRTAFGGRGNEYYSEDGLLAGKMGAAEITGCRKAGLCVRAKHFAVNDQESNRDINGLFTYSNEQAMREIYFRPFELAVKEGHADGLMNSFNRIGHVWAGACPELGQELLRDEWGFQGAVVTDWYGVFNPFMIVEASLYAGTDIILAGGPGGTFVSAADAQNDYYMQQALKQADKNLLYSETRGALVLVEFNFTWRVIWVVVDVVICLGIVTMIVFFGLDFRKKKNK